MEIKEKSLLSNGDKVSVKGLTSAPEMVVSKLIWNENNASLEGVRCFWFDKDHVYRIADFHSKDLVKK